MTNSLVRALTAYNTHLSTPNPFSCSFLATIIADAEIGDWNLDNISSGLSAFSLAVFTRPEGENGLGWSKEELEVLLARVRNDLGNTDIHAYFSL